MVFKTIEGTGLQLAVEYSCSSANSLYRTNSRGAKCLLCPPRKIPTYANFIEKINQIHTSMKQLGMCLIYKLRNKEQYFKIVNKNTLEV